MKKNKNLIYALIIPIIIVLIVLLLNKFYPFGDKSILMLDGLNQYPGFLSNIMNQIINHGSIFYSFNGLLGFNMFATSIYYVFNITNLLAFLFTSDNLINFYTFSVILKFGLASLTMCILLNNISKNKTANLMFSICYGLSVYNLLYYLNYMWFDSIIIFPLVILGIEKIFKEDKYLLYSITLSLSIIFNFYIGYMICIASLLYFIYKSVLNKWNKKRTIKYLLYSLLAGLISSFILLPVISELLNGKASLFTGYTKDYFKFDLDFINSFYKLTIGSYLNDDLKYGTPNIYVSILVLLNVFLFFFNKKISKKEKITTLVLIGFFLLSMSFNLLDYFWQMMQMPIWYPVRYAFIFDLFLIIIAIKNFNTYEKIPLKKLIIIILSLIGLIIIGFFTSGNLLDKVNIPAKLIYLGISILFIIYYTFMHQNKEFNKAIIIILLIELLANAFVTFRNNGNINSVNEYNNSYKINEEILNNIKDDSFYRLSFADKTISNNGLLLNYKDLNYFSSVRNNNTFNLLTGLGIKVSDGCSLKYYYYNPIVNSLLNIKYYISKEDLSYYNKINTIDDYNIYQNDDASSLGFTTNNKLKDLNLNDNYIENLNNILNTINNKDTTSIKEIKYQSSNISCSELMCIVNNGNALMHYEYKASTNEFIMIKNDFPAAKDETTYEIIINNKKYDSINIPYYLKKNDKIEININPTGVLYKDYDFHVYSLNVDNYQEFVDNIKENELKLTDYYNDSYFKGTITTKEDGLLFTSIPNDKGWKVYVDDKEEKITPILNGLIGIKLKEGTHTITFKYSVPYLSEGLIISSISLITLITLELIKKKK